MFDAEDSLATIGFIDLAKQGLCFDLRVQHFVFGFTSLSIIMKF